MMAYIYSNGSIKKWKKLLEKMKRMEETIEKLRIEVEEKDHIIKQLMNEHKEVYKGLKEIIERQKAEIASLQDKPRVSKGFEEHKFGGTQSVYCERCNDYHSFPYIPGKYVLCKEGIKYFLGVIVLEDGKIRVCRSYREWWDYPI